MKPLKNLSLNIFLPIIIGLFVMSCAGEDTEVVSENEEVKYTATQFVESIFYKDFPRAELFCDNASKGSIRKLANFKYDFRNIYFRSIDTCVITKNTATCICSYENYEADLFEQTLHLKKLNGEWLAHFILNENFDNIFLYDYETEYFDKNKVWTHHELPNEEIGYFINTIKDLNSNKLVLGHTYGVEISKIDSFLNKESDYMLESSVEFESLQFFNTYILNNGIVSEMTMDISTPNTALVDKYYKSIVDVMMSEFGNPYNMKDLDASEFYKAKNIYWFIKGYNEVVELRLINERVVLNFNVVI